MSEQIIHSLDHVGMTEKMRKLKRRSLLWRVSVAMMFISGLLLFVLLMMLGMDAVRNRAPLGSILLTGVGLIVITLLSMMSVSILLRGLKFPAHAALGSARLEAVADGDSFRYIADYQDDMHTRSVRFTSEEVTLVAGGSVASVWYDADRDVYVFEGAFERTRAYLPGVGEGVQSTAITSFEVPDVYAEGAMEKFLSTRGIKAEARRANHLWKRVVALCALYVLTLIPALALGGIALTSLRTEPSESIVQDTGVRYEWTEADYTWMENDLRNRYDLEAAHVVTFYEPTSPYEVLEDGHEIQYIVAMVIQGDTAFNVRYGVDENRDQAQTIIWLGDDTH